MKRIVLFLSCFFTTVALFATSWQSNFDFLPENLATAFGQEITKTALLEYYNNHQSKLPEWLPEPYNQTQAINLTLNFIDHKVIVIGAKQNNFLPTSELAASYLQSNIDKLNESARANFDKFLDANGLTMESYINKYKQDKKIQQEAANNAYIESLSKYYEITEKELLDYYNKNIDKYTPKKDSSIAYTSIRLADSLVKAPGRPSAEQLAQDIYRQLKQGTDIFVLSEAYNADYLERQENYTRPRLGTPNQILAAYDSLTGPNQVAKPFKMGTSWYVLRSEPMPATPFVKVRKDIEEILRQDRYSSVETTLNELSDLKINFDISELQPSI